MQSQTVSPLIETSEVAKLLAENSKNVTIVNANFGWKPEGFRPPVEWDDTFKEERIPTARFINAGLIGDTSKGLPNMLPTPENFVKVMKSLDIGRNDHVICYGDEGIIGPCRAYWMFKVFGFPNVQIMNGTFAKWKKEGHPVEKGDQTWEASKRERKEEEFQFEFNGDLVLDMDQIRNWIKDDKMGDVHVVDARANDKYQAGHIPGAKNIAFHELLGPDQAFKSAEEIRAIMESKNIDINKPVRSSCGAGMSACVLFAGFSVVGAKDKAVYDGSWAEWSKHAENPIEK